MTIRKRWQHRHLFSTTKATILLCTATYRLNNTSIKSSPSFIQQPKWFFVTKKYSLTSVDHSFADILSAANQMSYDNYVVAYRIFPFQTLLQLEDYLSCFCGQEWYRIIGWLQISQPSCSELHDQISVYSYVFAL